jgi:hypothetical protein
MNRIQQQVNENTDDISEINKTLNRLETNHIYHIEKDLEKQSKIIERMDMRLWGILILLVGSVVLGVITNGL